MVSFTNRFPQWGDTGETPPDGFEYEGGDQVNEKHLDYLWDAIQKQTADIISEFNIRETALSNHESATTGVHGVGASNVASEAYVDTAESDANTYTDTEIESHRASEVHDQPQPPEAHDHTGDDLTPDSVVVGEYMGNAVYADIASIPAAAQSEGNQVYVQDDGNGEPTLVVWQP